MAYYDPYNQDLKQPTGPMATYNTSTIEKIRRLARPAVGEIQQSSGFKLAGTGANIKNYPADLLRDSGMAKGAGLRANAAGAAKMGGRLLAAANAGHVLFGTAYDGATTSTEDYRKRFEGIGPDGDFIDKGSMVDKGLNAVGIGENGRQFWRDVLTRTGGALLDYGARAADSIPLLNADLSSRFADKQAATQPAAQPAPAAQPQVATQSETVSKPLTSADDGAIVGTGEHGFIAQQPKGLKSELYTNVPSQQDTFAASKGNVSTIQTGGAENYAKQLATIQGLREGLGPQGGQVSVIANPDKKAPPSALETVQNALSGMGGRLNASGLAALVEAQKADQTAATQRESIAQRDRENVAQAGTKNTGPSFRDLLEAKKFQYQVGRDQLQDGLAVDANNRNNRLAGATLAATGQNIEKGREDIASKQFESMFRKQDDKGNDVADTGSVGRFRTELAQAIDTLANSGDKDDVARFGIQYKKADGSTGLRARNWDELTDNDKAAMVRGFKFADHARKYADGGDRGGNFAEYMRGRKDAQGRVVFGSNGKTRAIVDAETLNSDGDSLNPLVAVNPFDKRKFGIYEPRDFSEFYK